MSSIKTIMQCNTKWDNKLMKHVKCEPYYKSDLGSDSYMTFDGRYGRERVIKEAKEYIDRLAKDSICGFILYYKGTESRHIYTRRDK